MIITKQKEPGKILEMLEGSRRVFLVGCGDCAATCGTGGEEDVAAMAGFLREHGKTITGTAVPEVACVSAQVKTALARHKEALRGSDAILVFACGSGVQCLKEADRMGLDVFPGCDSLYAALVDDKKSFQQVCRTCGDCLLDVTQGLCPVTRCAKGLMNGPCGGQDEGKCEVDRQRDCAWIMIYKRLREKGRWERLKERRGPKDHAAVRQQTLRAEDLGSLRGNRGAGRREEAPPQTP
ncbi:MAG: methylenetetrahydrofolate reductase C-terminal domain-containing protein [Deltaproteobacteria bacterium]